MGKRMKPSKGDIISIPLSECLFGFGQIISSYDKVSGGFMMAVFNYQADSLNGILNSDICNSSILFLGFTFDAKLYHKHWSIIGNHLENIEKIKTPYFKLGTLPGPLFITDLEGNRLASISEDIFYELNYRSDIAPIRYENALKAYSGLQEWIKEDYDILLYKHTLKSNKIAEKVLSGA